MADFSISLTIPDNRLTALVAALNWAWDDGSGVYPKTAAQLRAEYKARCQQALKDVFDRHQNYLAEQAKTVTTVEIT